MFGDDPDNWNNFEGVAVYNDQILYPIGVEILDVGDKDKNAGLFFTHHEINKDVRNFYSVKRARRHKYLRLDKRATRDDYNARGEPLYSLGSVYHKWNLSNYRALSLPRNCPDPYPGVTPAVPRKFSWED